MHINKLEPIKIMLNFFDEKSLKLGRQIAHFYGVKVVDVSNFLSRLTQHEQFKALRRHFVPLQEEMLEELLDCSVDVLFMNPRKNFELISFYLKLLKFRLGLNDCKYKGFVLLNRQCFQDVVATEELFYRNQLSEGRFVKENLKAFKRF